MNVFSSIFLMPSIAHLVRLTVQAILALSVFSILSTLYPTPLFSVAALAVFGFYVVGLARYSPVAFILLLNYMFFRFTTLLSGVAIEFGSEMPELGLFGEATGSTVRLTMVYVFFIAVATIVIEVVKNATIKRFADFDRVNEIQTYSWIPFFFVALLFLTLCVVIIGSKVGFPVFTGMSRLEFREEVGSKLFLLYMSNRSIFAALLGLLIAVCTGFRRKVSIALFIMLITVSIMFGEKFTSLMTLSMLVIIPSIVLNKRISSLNLTRLAFPLVVISALTIPVILSVYGWADDPYLAMERLTSRFSGQGQLWFVADRDMSCFVCLDLEGLHHNLSSFVSFRPNEMADQYPYFGAKYFMFNYMEDGLLFLFLETQALTLTFGLEPYLLATNGWLLQLLPLTICAVVYGLNLSYLMYGFFRSDPITVFLALKLYIWITVGLQQGELWLVFGYKIILVVIVCYIYERFISGRRIQLN